MPAELREPGSEQGHREWDFVLPDAELRELSGQFEFLREHVWAFETIEAAAAGYVVKRGTHWWHIRLSSADSIPELDLAAGLVPEEFVSGRSRVSLSVECSADAPGGLSSREIEISTLIAAGLSDKEIAARFGTSPRTVSTQITRLLTRYQLVTRSALAAIVTAEDWFLLPVPGEALRDLTLPAFAMDAALRTPRERRVQGEPRATGQPQRHPVQPGATAIQKLLASPTLAVNKRVSRAPLRIGLLVTSGAFADDGLEAARGAELALVQATRMYRGAHARPFEAVRIAVDPLSPESVAAGMRQLEAEDVDAVLSTYASALDSSIFEFTAEYGRPFLHTNSWTDSAQRVAQDPTRFAHTFQTSPTELSYTTGLMNYLRGALATGQLQPQRVSIIELDGFGCSLSTGNIHDELAAAGIQVGATISVGLTVDNPDDVAQKVLRSEPGLVIVSHLSVDVAIELQRSLRKVSLETPVFHLYTPSIPRFFEELGVDGEGVIWSTITGRTHDVLGQRFSDGFQREFGTAPGWSQSSAAYDQAQLLAQGFLYSGSRRAADVSDTLRLMVHRGVNGTYALGTPEQTVAGYPFDSPDPTLTTPTVTYRCTNGQMTVIGGS